MRKTFVALALFTLLFTADANAASSQAGEATAIITDVMREVLAVIVEFIGAVIDEIVRGLKSFF